MTNVKGVFYFSFSNGLIEDAIETNYAFTFDIDPDLPGIETDEWSLDGKTYTNIDYDFYEDAIGELEDYGVHDFCTSPHPEVASVGFSSYEVAAEKIPELMNKWREFFLSTTGVNNVGPIVQIEFSGGHSDLDIYNMTKRKENVVI